MRIVGSFCGYTVKPGMPVSLVRSSWMISSTPGRSARGLRRMKSRPVFGTTLVLLAPIEDMNGVDVRLLQHDGGGFLLVRHHAVERDVLRAFGEGEDLPRVLVGDEALRDAIESARDADEERRRPHERRQEDAERHLWMAEHQLERPPVGGEHAVEDALRGAVDPAVRRRPAA